MKINSARTVNEMISAISLAMDIENERKLYHGWRVAVLAVGINDALGDEGSNKLFYAGLLHDVGGVGLPHHLIHYLTKKRPGLSPDPLVIAHPLLSAEIISAMPGLDSTARPVLDHHENWDGHGFPRALGAGEIANDAQVLKAADTVDLLLRAEPPPDIDTVVAGIRNLANTQISPSVADCTAETTRILFPDVMEDEAIEWTFGATRARIGTVPVPRGVDAIGLTLEVLSRVVDNKHPYTIGHSRRVARYSLLIGIAMGMTHDEVTLLRWASLIHDVGKLSIPAKMLNKASALTPSEYSTLQRHAAYTFDIVNMITDLRPVAAVASGHHERFDGTGYPNGLAGNEIPIGARIIAVADAFDAMTSQRPYRAVNDMDVACAELEDNAGKQFDPAVVDIAVPVLRNLGMVIATST